MIFPERRQNTFQAQYLAKEGNYKEGNLNLTQQDLI